MRKDKQKAEELRRAGKSYKTIRKEWDDWHKKNELEWKKYFKNKK